MRAESCRVGARLSIAAFEQVACVALSALNSGDSDAGLCVHAVATTMASVSVRR